MWLYAPDTYVSHRSYTWEGELEKCIILSRRSWILENGKTQVFYWGNESKNTNHVLWYKKEKHEKGTHRNKKKEKTLRAFVPKGNTSLTDFTTDLSIKALLT